eukprot:jgi/Undpi1/8512/HiC_scaffold_25.g10979.m1
MSSDEEEQRLVGGDNELETIGAARSSRKKAEESSAATTATKNTPKTSVLDHNRCSKNETAKVKETPSSSKSAKTNLRKKLPGKFGLFVGWDVKDCADDNSEDESYAPPVYSDSSSDDGDSGGGGDGSGGASKAPPVYSISSSDDGDGGGGGDASRETLKAAKEAHGNSRRHNLKAATNAKGNNRRHGNGSAAKTSKKRVKATPSSSKSTRSSSKSAKTNRRNKVPGIFGIPVGWNAEDCDYDDSEDETFAPPISNRSSGSPTAVNGAMKTRAVAEAVVGARGGAGAVGPVKGIYLSAEVMLNGIVRPYLSAASKCALQRTCKYMRPLIDMPEAWENLDLRADVIGRRTMKSGRQSIMSRQPLFFLARSVVLQPRFSLLKTADLRGLNLGAMGSRPDLLVTLFDNCRHLTTLNLWKTYVEDEGLPQPDSAVEKLIAESLPGVLHLALEMDASNRGLKLLLERCRQLRSLHIGSRCNRRGDSISMYPNDLGMKAFAAVGAPHLETLSLVDKVSIGSAGLRCVLNESSCPRLKTLVLSKMSRVNDNCLKAISPSMGRVTSLTLDQCEVKPATAQFVVNSCSQLSSLVFCAHNSALERPQEGRPLFDFLLAQGSTTLAKVDVQQPRMDLDAPRWLLEDFAFYKTVRDSVRPRILVGRAETADDHIAPFMRGG